MASLHDFQTAKARQAARNELRRAEADLAEAQSQLELYCGVGISLALTNRLRAAEKRVDRAREALRAIDPTGTE